MAFFGPSLELEPALVRLANRIWSYHGPYLVWSRPGGICGSICEYAPYFVILPLEDLKIFHLRYRCTGRRRNARIAGSLLFWLIMTRLIDPD